MPKRDDANLPIDYSAQLSKRATELSERVQSGTTDRITIKNNTKFETPNGNQGETLEVVIVDFIAYNAYYDAAYDPDNISPPACFAMGLSAKTLMPSKNSPSMQVDAGKECKECPHDIFGTADNGKGKACKNSRLLAMVQMGSFDSDILTLLVPPASIKFFDQYATALGNKYKLDTAMVHTRLSLDSSKSFASPRFEIVTPLSAEEINQVGPRLEEARKRLMQEPDVSGYEPPKEVKRG